MNKLLKTFCGLVIQFLMPVALLAATPERWLHLTVTSDSAEGEVVRVNLPLSLAEKVLPAINADNLTAGKIRIHDASINGVDMRALAEAVRTTPDSEFVQVENREETVHIRKSAGNLLINVRQKRGGREKVDIKVPFPVISALFSGPGDQLDLTGALRALEANGDAALVTVNDETENVKIWVDTRSSTD